MKTALQDINAIKPGVQVAAIKRMFESFGTGHDGIHRVARAFHISESAAEAMATAVTTAPKKAVTESAPDLTAAGAATDAVASRKVSLAVRLQTQVQAAEAKPLNECSIQELEALAAAAGADAGMFG